MNVLKIHFPLTFLLLIALFDGIPVFSFHLVVHKLITALKASFLAPFSFKGFFHNSLSFHDPLERLKLIVVDAVP